MIVIVYDLHTLFLLLPVFSGVHHFTRAGLAYDLAVFHDYLSHDNGHDRLAFQFESVERCVLVSSTLDIPVTRTTAEKVQMCLPESDLRYDMGCNIMAFDPGVTFPCTEMHVFEHGEYVLNGRASIFLNGTHHEMMPEDFVYINAYLNGNPENICTL